MAYKKSINHLTISKLKSKDLIEWFVGVATWKEISGALNIGHSKVFKFKRILREKVEEETPFDALAETFTVKELNDIIAIYNDYLENPEKYKKTKKRSEIDLESQKNTVNKHLAEMGSMKIENINPNKTNQEDAQAPEQASEQEEVQETEQAPEQEEVQETEQAPEQEEVQGTEQAPEQEEVQETEQASEQEEVQETEQASETVEVQEPEQAPVQEDTQEPEQPSTQGNIDVQETEQAPLQKEIPYRDKEKKSEVRFNGAKPVNLRDLLKNKRKK